MSERDDILIRLGLDSTQLTAGTAATLDAERKAAMDYTAFWDKAIAQREAADLEANQESLARLKEFDAQKLAETERFFAAQKAMYEENAAIAGIAQGSVPSNLERGAIAGAEGAIGAAAVGTAEKEVVKTAEKGGTGAVNEFFVLIREGLRGTSPARIASSALRLAGLLFDGILGVSLIAIAGVGVAQLVGMATGTTTPIQTFQAIRNALQGRTDLKNKQKLTGEEYKDRIGELQKRGMISKDQADEFRQQIDSGDYGQLNQAMHGINPLLANLRKKEAAEAAAKAATKQEQFLYQSATEQRKGLNDPAQRLRYDTEIRAQLVQQFLKGADVSKEIKDNWDKILQDHKDITEEIKKHVADQADYNKKIDELHQSFRDEENRIQQRITASGSDYPTLQQLAKYGGTAGKNWYGHKTFFRDPAGQYAADILGLQRDQINSRLRGNVGRADNDASRITYLKDSLAQAGFISPDNKLENMENHLGEINSAIAALNAAAQGTGLAIKAGE